MSLVLTFYSISVNILLKMSVETNNNNPLETPLPLPYDLVVTEHPQIKQTIKALKAKREFRAEEYKAGRWSKGDSDSTIEGFVGMGDEKTTFAVDEFAIKILHDQPKTHYTFEDQIECLKRGEGIDGLEQLVTGSREEGIIITELITGQSIASFSTLELIRLVKPKHVARLETTLEAMRERELDFDNVGNILFDPENGFNFVDYRFITHKGAPIGSKEEPWNTQQHR